MWLSATAAPTQRLWLTQLKSSADPNAALLRYMTGPKIDATPALKLNMGIQGLTNALLARIMPPPAILTINPSRLTVSLALRTSLLTRFRNNADRCVHLTSNSMSPPTLVEHARSGSILIISRGSAWFAPIPASSAFGVLRAKMSSASLVWMTKSWTPKKSNAD